MTRPEVRTLRDAAPLAALAHPFRSRIMDALKVDGPSTASMLAARTGQAVGNASHHLKVLAAAGLVEEAPELARDRRERWWRLVSAGTRWSRRDLVDQAAVTAAEEAEALVLRRQQERVRDWMANADTDPEWDDAAFATQHWMRLSPAELGELSERGRSRCSCAGSSREVPDDGVAPRAGVRLRPRLPEPAVTAGPHRSPRRSPVAGNRNFRPALVRRGRLVLGRRPPRSCVPLRRRHRLRRRRRRGWGCSPPRPGCRGSSSACRPAPGSTAADARRVMIVGRPRRRGRPIGSVPVAWALGRAHPPPPGRRRARRRHRIGVPARRLPPARAAPRRPGRPRSRANVARLFGTESAMQVVGPGLGGALVAARLRRLRRRRRRAVLPRLGALPAPHGLAPVPPASRPTDASRCAPQVATGIRVVVRDDRFLRFFTLQGGVVQLRAHRVRRAARALPRARPRPRPAAASAS